MAHCTVAVGGTILDWQCSCCRVIVTTCKEPEQRCQLENRSQCWQLKTNSLRERWQRCRKKLDDVPRWTDSFEGTAQLLTALPASIGAAVAAVCRPARRSFIHQRGFGKPPNFHGRDMDMHIVGMPAEYLVALICGPVEQEVKKTASVSRGIRRSPSERRQTSTKCITSLCGV